jgi:predicted metal-binding membrane protein
MTMDIQEAPAQPALHIRHQAETVTLVALAAFATVAWIVTINRMAGMDAGPGTDLGTPGWFIVGWMVMMAAMMVPSLAPAALAVAGAEAEGSGTQRRSSYFAAGAFIAGYLLPWALFGLLAYAVVEGVRSLDFAFLSWSEGGPYLAAGVILVAALYELTPLKRTCLRHCRNPSLLVQGPHSGASGYAGAMRKGIVNGAYCVGCCWALMAALFAVGVMSVAWMVVFAVLIAADKLLPWSSLVTIGIVVVLVVLGASVAFAPDRVPGLTAPGSPHAMQAMNSMGMDRGN